jgi:hypothetical protein
MADEQRTASSEAPHGVSGEILLTEQDFLQAAPFALGFRRARRFGYVGLLVMTSALLTVAACERGASHPDWGFVAQLLGGTVIAVMFVASIWWQTKTWARNLASVAHATRFCFDDDGYTSQTAHSHSRIAWEGFASYLETSSAFLLYMRNQILFILPKRIFNPREVEWLRATLRARVAAQPIEAGEPSRREASDVDSSP